MVLEREEERGEWGVALVIGLQYVGQTGAAPFIYERF